MSDYGLFPQHAELLADSAISAEIAKARGYESVDARQRLEDLGFEPYQRSVPGLLIPLHRADGSVWGYQYRPDKPRKTKAKKPRTIKYESPKGQRNGIDVPAAARDAMGDPSAPLWITEGSRKADSAVSAGLACVSLNGVWAWRGSNAKGGKHAVPDWHDIALNGRHVIMAFDSDAVVKPDVQAALRELAAYLAAKGAEVDYLHLPHGDEAKTGLDDFIAANGAGGLMGLVRPEPPVISSEGTPRAHPHTRTPLADQPEQVCAPDGVCAHTPSLASKGDLLAEAVATVYDLGVAGESRVIKGTFLTAVSQVLAEPISLVVKGSSAGGKSYSTRTTLRLFPGGDPDAEGSSEFYMVTAGSQRSLIYTDEEFAHRTIVMFEATALREVAEKREGDMTAMLVRTLLSEGRIVYDTTERGDDGKMAGRRITKKGPTNLIVTTTADNLHHENETRLLSLTVDESEEQTREVLRKIAFRRNQPVPVEPPDTAPWHALFHWIKYHGEHRVYIPYADFLADNAAATVVRMRRDFGLLLGMIEAHAVLHQATRQRDQYGRIVATLDDYQAARDILADAFAVSTGRKVKDAVRKAVAAVEALGGRESDVTVAQVAKHMKRDRSRATRGLKEAADLGYLTNEETGPGKAARYRLGSDPLPEDKPALPDTLPDDALWASTPAQDAQVSPQVSEGCAGVRVCAGDAEVIEYPSAPAGQTSGDDTAPGFYAADEGEWTG